VIPNERMDFWFNNNRNVLFVGKHGTGKTSLVKSCFERNGLIHGETYLYFSASTLDPWVDLVGVPYKKVNKDGSECLDLVRPAALANGLVQAIFFDEFNRSPKKVRNAVMELMQFKSINGFKFPNLKAVWAAINPDDDDTYDVEKIDPAQKDRFHVIKEIDYKCDQSFFISRFGSDCGSAAVEWWDSLPETEKDKITPRRLEYALDEWEKGGNVQDILPFTANVNKLIQSLRHGPIEQKIAGILKSKDYVAAKTFLANDNNFHSSIKIILDDPEKIDFFVPQMPKERLISLMSENDSICRYVCNHSTTNKDFWRLMRDIVVAGQNEKLVKRLTRFVSNFDDSLIKNTPLENPSPAFFVKGLKSKTYTEYSNLTFQNLDERIKFFEVLKKNIAEDISIDDAKNIILALGHITEDVWSNNLVSPAFEHLTGIINHCLKTIFKEEDDYLNQILGESKKVGLLFTKLSQNGLLAKVIR